jgi:carboxypeptidase T
MPPMHDRPRPRSPLAGHARLAVTAALALAGLVATPGLAAPAAAADFPAGWEGFHTYAEMAADVAAVEMAHPDIAHRFSIGKSYQGREIWAMKISDNVALDEDEPEALFDGGTHSDEHMGVEMALRIMHWLVDGYGTDPRITNIVNKREIWIIFSVNPDGAAYDIKDGKFHFWRKNRQPTPGTPYIGTDLNRNYGYKWGGGGLTSTNPKAITYRGPSAFSAPETRAVRDFLKSRVVGGRQQIRVHITFHEYGRLVMWPYGYTYKNVPGDMTTADHDALVKIGRAMAATNGYRPEQASDLYVTSGTTRDYTYGTYRIFSYTFELSTKDYPDDSKIATETGRNKAAVLYLLERAWCPLGVLGATATTARCGAFDDDLEVARGWTVDPDGTDTAHASTSGRFARSNPASTSSSGPKQLGTTTSGTKAFVTGAPAGARSTSYDLDGRTSIRSASIALPSATGQRLTFRYVFAHSASSTAADGLRAIVEAADGSRTTVFARLGKPVDVDGVWRSASIPLDAWAGQTIHLRFEAVDGGPPNLLEVEIDDIRVTRPT